MPFDYVTVEINRSENTIIPVDVPPWEVPVLTAVNGEDRCRVIGKKRVERELPDANGEFDRLALKYKADGESGQEYVVLVYGQGARGVKALEDEIAKVEADEGAAAPAGDVGDTTQADLAALGLIDAPAFSQGAQAIDA